MSIGGVLLADKGKADTLKDVVVDGSTGEQFLRFTGFTAPDLRATYRPDRVPVESLDGQVLAARDQPRAAFAGHTDSTRWDDLHLAYFVGYANWNYLTTPFVLAGEGFVSEELVAPGGVAPPRHSAHYDSSARLARHENPQADRATY